MVGRGSGQAEADADDVEYVDATLLDMAFHFVAVGVVILAVRRFGASFIASPTSQPVMANVAAR